MAKLNLKTYKNQDTNLEGYWNILIVDDDPEVHTLTRLVMKDWVYNCKGMHLLFAHSSGEARQILDKQDLNIALILLDVVMENDHSGLDLVKYIRDVMKNNLIRIILRTGQSGKAPVRKVISDYVINDYKEKNELTADRFYDTVTAALRGYEELNN